MMCLARCCATRCATFFFVKARTSAFLSPRTRNLRPFHSRCHELTLFGLPFFSSFCCPFFFATAFRLCLSFLILVHRRVPRLGPALPSARLCCHTCAATARHPRRPRRPRSPRQRSSRQRRSPRSPTRATAWAEPFPALRPMSPPAYTRRAFTAWFATAFGPTVPARPPAPLTGAV